MTAGQSSRAPKGRGDLIQGDCHGPLRGPRNDRYPLNPTLSPHVRTGVRGNRCTGHIGNRLLAIPKINLVDTLMAEQDVKNSVDLRGLESDWIAGEGAADPELPPVHVRHAALLHLAHQQLRRVLDGR